MHWADYLAKKVLTKKSPPFVVSAGASTTGSPHFGTVCEFLYPWALAKVLKEKAPTKYVFVMDDMDPLKKIQDGIAREHLGKPVAMVPDPQGSFPSLAERVIWEITEAMQKLKAMPDEIVRASKDFYFSGAFEEYALLFWKRWPEIRKTLREVAGNSPESPINPICERCGRIVTTRVTSMEGNRFSYVCDRKTKFAEGCGYEGEGILSEGKYKLPWRLHWVAWFLHLKTSVEGAGADHHASGGSWDSAKAVLKLLGKEPPVGYRYGLLLLAGKKYSKSAGMGGISEVLSLIPPFTVKYALLKKPLQSNQEFSLTPERVLDLVEEYERVTKGEGDEGKQRAASLVGEPPLEKFSEALLLFGVFREWGEVEVRIGEVSSATKKWVERWVEKGFLPRGYGLRLNLRADSLVKDFLDSLREGMEAEEIHQRVYEFAEEKGIKPKEVFERIYLALFGQPRGPRLGKLLKSLGIQRLQRAMAERFKGAGTKKNR